MALRFNFITLFPEKIQTYFDSGLQKKALQNHIFEVRIINLREFANNKHNKVDDTVYGGGPGMLLKIEPVDLSLEFLGASKGIVILTSPSGILFDQQIAEKIISEKKNITFISGYYEGIDHRVSEYLIDKELSIGKFILSSGDLAALVMFDVMSRLLDGFVGFSESLKEESHNQKGILEYPQYTKPRNYKGYKVPEVMFSGNHSKINIWRRQNRKNKKEEK